MKKLLIFSVIAAFGTAAAFGQTAVAGKPLVNTSASTFIREKFDPKRDPKADLADAVAAASKSGKRIILDVGGEWCSWCIHMDKFIAAHEALNKLRDDNFVWLKVNYSEENENRPFLSAYPEPLGFPHLYVLDGGGKLLHSEDTSLLEAGETYNLAKFTNFLKKWSPPVPAK